MKKVLSFLMVSSALLACDKPFSLDLPLAVDSHEYNLTTEAGEARLFFYTTREWSIALEPSDCSWASIDRTSGSGEEDVEEIVFTYQENSDADRQVTLVISAGDLQERITMFQTGLVRDWWNGSVSVDDLVVKPQQNQ